MTLSTFLPWISSFKRYMVVVVVVYSRWTLTWPIKRNRSDLGMHAFKRFQLNIFIHSNKRPSQRFISYRGLVASMIYLSVNSLSISMTFIGNRLLYNCIFSLLLILLVILLPRNFITARCTTVQRASCDRMSSVCDVDRSVPHRLKILEINCVNN